MVLSGANVSKFRKYNHQGDETTTGASFSILSLAIYPCKGCMVISCLAREGVYTLKHRMLINERFHDMWDKFYS